MIDHVSIGVRDIARARRFYDAVLKPLGYVCQHESGESLGYGDERRTAFWVSAVKRPVPADLESGLHICFAAPSQASVDAFHAKAVESGGSSNGEPGFRADYGPGYYAAFAIDPDGYRVEAYVNVPQQS